MATFTVTYTTATDANGTFLQLTPSRAVISASAIDQIKIVNAASSDITIEAIPLTCSAFDEPGELMRVKIKDGQSKHFDLREDLAGAFLHPMDFMPLLWRAKSKSGAVDRTGSPLHIPRSRLHFQIAIQA